MADELSDLVNNPEERLYVELKSWLDLKEPKHRADLARHIAAISNLGGGYIVFGFNNDRTPCGNPPPDFRINHDSVASITKKYLEPSIHCDVRQITSSHGIEHFIIVVPPHGSVPVCAKANGPEINGKVHGINSGTYYLRKSGPESAPIINASEWVDIIRRCALHDRGAILAAVTAALSGSSPVVALAEKPEPLLSWMEAANQTYAKTIGTESFEVPIQDCRLQLGYMVHTEKPEMLPHKDFTNLLRQLCFEVDQQVNSGWSLFYVFDVKELAPNWRSDPDAGVGDSDFLEANLVSPERTFGFDLWRVSPQGLATTIREYWEDAPEAQTKPRSFFNPMWLAMWLSELVRHAEVFSGRFSTPLSVEFICEWRGLKGRRLHIPNSLFAFANKAAVVDSVRSGGIWPVGKLANERPQIVADLGARVARAFDWHDFTPQWIANQQAHWR